MTVRVKSWLADENDDNRRKPKTNLMYGAF